MENSTPYKIVTPENFILKLCTRNCVREITHHANFGFSRYSGGFSPNNVAEILLVCDFFDCPILSLLFSRSCAQVEPLDRCMRRILRQCPITSPHSTVTDRRRRRAMHLTTSVSQTSTRRTANATPSHNLPSTNDGSPS